MALHSLLGWLWTTLSTLQFGSFVAKVNEGYVGLNYYAGKLSDEVLQSGVHVTPWPLQHVVPIKKSSKVLRLQSVLCPTMSGVDAVFPSVEVVFAPHLPSVVALVRNFTHQQMEKSLISDPVVGILADVCSRMTLREATITKFDQVDEMVETQLREFLQQVTGEGMQVMDVRLSKPQVPRQIQAGFTELEGLKASSRVVTEMRHRLVREAEAARERAVKAGQSALDVAKIALERQINHAVGNKGLAKAEVETQMQSMRAQADSEAYAIKRQAEAEAVWLTKAALELEAAQQLPRNLRMFLGPDIPRAVIEEPDPVRRPPALPGSGERDARAQAAGDQRDASEPAAGREQTSTQRSAQRQRHHQLQQSVVIDSAVAQEQGYVPS
ncbi:hypothetical protein FNF29_00796 [Cafeteria roenbergensis]|uniref:Band 7 domain-containing protein n=1 Tax=Cafeteria roenbergensis TaxID=33653 RepID=A0A5A8CUB9_CAFRO|nr:hypothetical protein FNF29_00796 [Cafeteria roenbergensis]|eukprot:KAA0156685.1 hypothetical protein FNF29_00796 [Cafeteria roenbergensis]